MATSLSVIIPFYRELDFLWNAIDSVVKNAAWLKEVEIIVCNDGSFDEATIRASISPDANPLVKVLTNRYASGPGGARNTGLDAAGGDIIAFLDADDLWLSDKLKLQIEAILAGATFVSTGYRFSNSGVVVVPPKEINCPEDIFLKRGLGTSTIVIKREILDSRRFRDFRFSQDIDFWYLLAHSPVFCYCCIPEVFVTYNDSGGTRNKWDQFKSTLFVMNANKLNLWIRFRALSSYIFYGIYNHYIAQLFNSWHKSEN